MYVLGYFFYIKDSKAHRPPETDMTAFIENIKLFVIYSMPIWISFAGALIFKMPFYVSLMLGIVATRFLAKLVADDDVLEKGILKHSKDGFKGKMVLAIIGIMFFKNVVNNFDDLYVFYTWFD